MISDLILKNEALIQEFNIEVYRNEKNYPVVAALAALDTTNDIQECYLKLKNATLEGEAALRLYALLQSLFVSIDSLYALSYSLTRSKSIININKNQNLRELKYIRNDVVGHPANRMLNATTLAYCVLDDQKITADAFFYDIYTGSGVEKKKVQIIPLIESYYIESNQLLNELYLYAKTMRKKNKMVHLAIAALDLYGMRGDYEQKLAELKKVYQTSYPNSTSSQHRVMWRLEQIEKLKSYPTDNQKIQEVLEYSIGLELIKIYQLLSGKLDFISLRRRTPEWVSSFYRFLNKNKKALVFVNQITDLKHPLFKNALHELRKLATEKGYLLVLDYLNLIEKLYYDQEDDLLYGFTLPLREYKKQK